MKETKWEDSVKNDLISLEIQTKYLKQRLKMARIWLAVAWVLLVISLI